MDHDRFDLPEAQVFRLDDAVLIVCSPEPEVPEPEPPPRMYDEDATQAVMTMRPLVEGVLRRSHVAPADVPDLTQNVLVDLLEWWATQRPVAAAAAERTARAYVALVARRAAYRYHDQRRRRRESRASEDPELIALDERDASLDLSDASPEDAVLTIEARAVLAAEMNLDKLGASTAPAFWRAFYAHTVLSVPVNVIAESESVPVPTIYNRIRLAREDLQASVRRERAAKRV